MYIVTVAEAEVTFGTMILVHIASFAEAALGTYLLVAIVALGAVDAVLAEVSLEADTADVVLHAGVLGQIGLLAGHNHAAATVLALHFGAVCAMPNDHVGTAALLSTMAESLGTVVTEILGILGHQALPAGITGTESEAKIVALIVVQTGSAVGTVMAFIAFVVAIFAAIAAFFAEVFHQIVLNFTPDIRCILRKRVIILFFAIAGSALLTGKAQIHRSFPVGIGLVNPVVVGFPGKGHARMQE